jgi:ankyrin repeat protein
LTFFKKNENNAPIKNHLKKRKKMNARKAQLIAEIKRKIEKISIGSDVELKSFPEALEKAKDLIDIPHGMDGSIAEYAITTFFNSFKNRVSYHDDLLSVINTIFTLAPEVINKAHSSTPLLHLIAYYSTSYTEAMLEKTEELFELFFKHKADFNIQDKAHCTSAHVAVKKGNFCLLPLLIKFGCGINQVSSLQQTPLDIFLERVDRSPEEFLRDHGALTKEEVLNRSQNLLSQKLSFSDVKAGNDRALDFLDGMIATDPRGGLLSAFLNIIEEKNESGLSIAPERMLEIKSQDRELKSLPQDLKERLKQKMPLERELFTSLYADIETCQIAWKKNFSVDPNTPTKFGPTLAFAAIRNKHSDKTEENTEASILNLRRYYSLGVDFSLRDNNGDTVFDVLAKEKRLHYFLADFHMRAILLSSDKFDFGHIRRLLEQEKQEIVLLQEKEEEEAKAAALQRERDIIAARAFVASKKRKEDAGDAESKNHALPKDQEKEINNAIKLLKLCENPRKLNSPVFKNMVEKSLSHIIEAGEIDKLRDLLQKEPGITQEDHRFLLINKKIEEVNAKKMPASKSPSRATP